MLQNNIPISVVVVTKNEEARIATCLDALSKFDEIWVVDSQSADRTTEIAAQHSAKIVNYVWDGRYPKKRQWCLDTLELAHDWVFFVDADESVTPDLADEIAALDFTAAGYFIPGQYLWNGRLLRHGLRNQKIALLNRHRMEFPIIDDLDLPGMGEIEGHYQPVLKGAGKIGRLKSPLIHDAGEGWDARHERYAAWEAGMNAKDTWPRDPSKARQALKDIFRTMPGRPATAFLHSYIFKLGFLDGKAGFDFARARARYYTMINAASKTNRVRAAPVASANSKFASR